MENKELPPISISELMTASTPYHIGTELMLVEELTEINIPSGVCRTTYITVGLCLQGHSKYTVNTIEHDVAPNDILIIPDGQVMGHYTVGPDNKGISMLISPDFYHETVKDIHELSSLIIFSRSHPVFRLSQAETRNMTAYYEMIKEKIGDTSNFFRRETVSHLISAMLYELNNTILRMQTGDADSQVRAKVIFAEFIRLVEHNYMHERRVSWYSRQMSITQKYLSETVKTVSNRTPKEWIDNYVIMELRSMLKNTTKSINEIAANMNFSNQSFLGKFFKEHVGMSPVSYRKS